MDIGNGRESTTQSFTTHLPLDTGFIGTVDDDDC